MNNSHFLNDSVVNVEREQFLSLIGFNRQIVHAKNSRLTCNDGNEYLDFSSQYGVMLLGHNHDRLQSALRQSVDSNEAVMVQPMATAYAQNLGKKILELIGNPDYRYVQFTNSGTETVEGALKLAKSKTQRQKVLATINGFHGKTEGSVKATGTVVYREPFCIDAHLTDHIPYGDIPSLENALRTQEYAAFIVEPIQGEGGMIVPPAGYLKEVKKLCSKYDTVFIADEIQTGLGRTGDFLACQYEQVDPDIILLSKGLSGGLIPLGAIVIKDWVWTKTFGLYHSSTFSNNNLAARVGLELVNALSENECSIIRCAKQNGNYLFLQLEKLVSRYPDVFKEVRGRGMMLGLVLNPWKGERFYMMSYASSVGFSVPMASGYLLNQHNIICLPTLTSHNVLRIQPALTISKQEIDLFIEALDQFGKLITSGRQEMIVSSILLGKQEAAHKNIPISTSSNKKLLAKPASGRCLGRFAFFLHPVNDSDIHGDIALGNSELSTTDRQNMERWINKVTEWSKDRLEAGLVYETDRIYNNNGDYVKGFILTSLLKPKELVTLTAAERQELFSSYFEKIENLNLDYIGLGAYTSVITKGGIELLDKGVNVTTGNSLTALSCAEAIVAVAQQTSVPLSGRTVGICGAYGSVGRLAAIALSSKANQLLLVGNPLTRTATDSLKAIAGEIYQHLIYNSGHQATPIYRHLKRHCKNLDVISADKQLQAESKRQDLYLKITEEFAQAGIEPPVCLTVQLDPWLPKIDALLTATSAGRSFMNLDKCRSGTIICDAAQPPDIVNQTQRDDLILFSGGELWLPDRGYKFGKQNINGLPVGKALACLSETITLTMSDVREHRSVGMTPSYDQAVEIHEFAKSFGFETAIPAVSTPEQLSKKTSSTLTAIS